MARRKLVHPPKHGVRRGDDTQREVLVQRLEIHLAERAVEGEQRLDLRRKRETARRLRVVERLLSEMIARRKETQPIGEWSCGSTFTNPKGDHAARLIEAAGLKGTRIGDVMVSPKHANFLVNVEAARASDVERLVQLIQLEVKRQFGVQLTPEFHLVGEAG